MAPTSFVEVDSQATATRRRAKRAGTTTQAVLAGGDWIEHDVNDEETLRADFVQETLVAMVADEHGKIAGAAARSSPEHHWMRHRGGRAGRWLAHATMTQAARGPPLALSRLRTHVTRGFQVELAMEVGGGARLLIRATHDALDLGVRVSSSRIVVPG